MTFKIITWVGYWIDDKVNVKLRKYLNDIELHVIFSGLRHKIN